jgi:hypothetical protein
VSRCSAALFGGVGSRPSAACEDSHHANLHACDPERASTQSVALACEWACGCPPEMAHFALLQQYGHERWQTIHLPSLHTLPSIGAGLTYSAIATRDGPMAPGPMAAAPPQSSCNRFKPRNSFRFILPLLETGVSVGIAPPKKIGTYFPRQQLPGVILSVCWHAFIACSYICLYGWKEVFF